MLNGESQSKLLHVQLLFRHGDRTPLSATRIHPKETTPLPHGKLINKGRERAYKLGQFLAERYKTFLDRIDKENVNAKSSMFPRCLETTQLLLAGLFPPRPENIWSDEIPLAAYWQPFPINTVPYHMDNILISQFEQKIDEMIENNKTHPLIEDVLNEYKEYHDKICKHLNLPPTVKAVMKLYDAIVCEKSLFGNDFMLPDWLSEDELYEIEQFYEKSYKLLYRGHTEDDQQHLLRKRVAPFLKHSLDSFKQSFYHGGEVFLDVLGSHDSKISELMMGLQFDISYPQFCSTVAIELWQDDDDDEPYVKINYIEPYHGFKVTEFELDKSPRFKGLAKGKICKITNFEKAFEDILTEEF